MFGRYFVSVNGFIFFPWPLSSTSMEEENVCQRLVHGFIFFDFIVAQIVGLVIIITGIIDCFINLRSRTISEK